MLQTYSGRRFTALNFKFMDTINLSTVRQSFANATFTHKVQEIAAENARDSALIVKILNIALVSLAFIFLLLQVNNPSSVIYSYIGSGVAAAEVLFLIVQLSFNFDQSALTHKNCALKYMQLRDKYRLLIGDIMENKQPYNEIISRREMLQQEYQVISDLSPQTKSNEYIEAQKRLNTANSNGGEQFTWSDEEIDRFLPESLRLKK